MDRTEDIQRAFIIGDTVPVLQVLLIAALESALGRMPDCPNILVFSESARLMEFMTAPSGEYFNFLRMLLME